MNTPLPVVKAFLVCDQIIQDAQTGKISLIGLFQDLRADRFPATHPSLWIYTSLTNARGAYTFEIQLVDVANSTVLGKGTPPTIQIPGPLETAEMCAQLGNLQLPRPGTYEFQLLANGELLATKHLRVSAVRPPTT
ncbi:MAG: hypothetical protein O2894_08915 [Planctomycetota bacterium]|nr:hypothetical protein [Planctomycetota bacterium]